MSCFDPLHPIGNRIYLFEPEEPTTRSTTTTVSSSTDPDPALIILCTWLGGATSSRIQKYISGYRALYPNSAILLITTRILEISALPVSVLFSRLAPARRAIRQIAARLDVERNRSMLLHIFSHGGCNTAIQLAMSFSTDDDDDDEALDFAASLGGIIFDCCPGGAGFWPAYQAAVHSLPPTQPALAQGIGRILLYPAVGLITGLQTAGWVSSVQDLRTQLNDPELFGLAAKRLYLYSTADQLVSAEDVESHMKEARARLVSPASGGGIDIAGRAFMGSPHCALVRDHAARYWDAIRCFWAGTTISPEQVRSRI